MSANFDIDGIVKQLDGRVAPDEVVSEEDAGDVAKLSKLLTRIVREQAEARRRATPQRLDFEDIAISSSAPVRLHHGLGGRVRYAVHGLSTGGGLAPVFAQSSATDENTLVLDAYQPVVLYLPSNFTTTSNTAQSTALTFPVRTGEQWLVLFWGFAGCSTANGMKYAIGAPAGSTVDGILDSSLTSATDDAHVAITAVNTLTSAVHTVAGGQRDDFISARLGIAASGSVTIQVASNTGGDTTTLRSYAALIGLRMRAGSATFAPTRATVRVEEAG